MYIVGNVYISDDLTDEFFVCDLDKCKGACCVEGDAGAPLLAEELSILEDILPQLKPYLSPQAQAVIAREGAYTKDDWGDFATPTIGGRECVYAFYDEKKILRCAIETAYRDGKISFQKPISCHLYPIRITRLDIEEALNYHRWQICDPACQLGKSLAMPIYKFLREPLIRKYGEAWYLEFDRQVEERKNEKPTS
ncbi:MAG: DUF3109 family protein [Microscillaceae bacterium]|jgi:hypothetical protein|nr:DUF3109 family protein [Microscillaceae bacterium]